MTDAPGTAVAVRTEHDDDDDGLGDFKSSDMKIPRLVIDHKRAMFVDSLDSSEANEIEVVILGLVKQRVLWPEEPSGTKEFPLCRSLNHEQGRPDSTNDHARFPWKASGFNKTDFSGTDQAILPCESCKLKEWGTHPKRGTVPWCAEQYVLLVMQPVDGGGYAPALVTFQGSGITATQSYLTSFKRVGKSPRIVTTKIRLQAQKRGTVEYAVPSFSRGTPTDDSHWTEWKELFNETKKFLHTPRQDDEGDATDVVAAAAQETATPVTPSGAAAAPANDDLPF